MAEQGKSIVVAWDWPPEQVLSYKITPEKTGAVLSASSVAKQLLAVSKLLETTEDGLRWKTMLRGIFTHEDGSIQFDLAIMPRTSALVPQQQISGSGIPNNCPQNTIQEKT